MVWTQGKVSTRWAGDAFALEAAPGVGGVDAVEMASEVELPG